MVLQHVMLTDVYKLPPHDSCFQAEAGEAVEVQEESMLSSIPCLDSSLHMYTAPLCCPAGKSELVGFVCEFLWHACVLS